MIYNLQSCEIVLTEWESDNLEGDVSDQGLANSDIWAKSDPSPDFVNKVLLKDSHAHSYTYFLWLLLCYHGRVE